MVERSKKPCKENPMKTTYFVIMLLLASTFGTAEAASINARQARQSDRIAAGVAGGSLTAPEAGRLVRQQRSIARMEHRFRADGYFGRAERAVIQTRLDRANRRIYRQKHDGQYRGR